MLYNRTSRAALTPSGCWQSFRLRCRSRWSVAKLPSLRIGLCLSRSVKLQSWCPSFSNGATGASPVQQYGGRAETPGAPLTALPPVVRHWLGMNQYPKQFRSIVFEPNLERCLNIVHSRKRHIVGQSAVAGNIKPRAYLLELEFVHVHHVGKLLHDILEPLFQFRLANNLLSRFNCRWLTFDMRQDGRDFRDLGAHLRFQSGNFIVRLLHAELLIEFQMLFHMQLPIQVLHADVMHVEVVAGSHGADAVKN